MDFDPVLAGMFRLLHVNGCTPPHRAVWAAERLMDGLGGLESGAARARAALASAFLRQALVFSPLDTHVDGMLAALRPLCPFPEPFARWREATARARASAQGPGGDLARDITRVEELAAEGDAEGVAEPAASHPAPLVRFMALVQLWQMGARDECAALYPGLADDPALNPAAPFFAWALRASGDLDAALALSAAAPENFLSCNLRAEAAREAGNHAEAEALFRRSLEYEPGQTRLALRPPGPESVPDPELAERCRVHIGFYTFNKLDVTLSTLSSLMDTNIGSSPVTLLNNGSDAFTREDLDAGVERIAGPGRVRVLHLPVNIGAPAARNWLYHLPEADRADYYAFLDDDVLLPGDWLVRFLNSLRRDARATGVGAKVVEPFPLPVVQYGWRFFLKTGPNLIRFTDNAPMVMDLGQYDLERPSLSVMGCCHLFDRGRLRDIGAGDFDIRFSPSQVDDLERDIRIWHRGGKVLYNGLVRVVHLKGTGPKVRRTGVDQARLWANHMKMERKYTAGQLAAVDAAVAREDHKLLVRGLADMPGPLADFCAGLGIQQGF